LIEVVKLVATGIALEGLSRNAIRQDDIMLLELDVQILKGI